MRKGLRCGFSSVVTLIGVFLLFLTVVAGVYLVGQKVSFKPRASEVVSVNVQEEILEGKAVRKKVWLVAWNPTLKSRKGVKLLDYYKWNDYERLTEQLISDFKEVSGGYVNYEVVGRDIVDGYPVFKDQFVYDEKSYLNCWDDPDHKSCSTSSVDYNLILSKYNLCKKVNDGKVDEIWLWSFPYSNIAEASMAGPGAFDITGEVVTGTSCQKKVPIMGFNYERGVAMALESYGHRVERIMSKVFGGWAYSYGEPPKAPPIRVTAWDKFSKRGFDPGQVSGCGNIHGSANTPEFDKDNFWGYDWTNKKRVQSICDAFLDYPGNLSKTTEVSCRSWGDCSDCTPFSPDRSSCRDKWLDYGYAFKKWWFNHLPRGDNFTNGIANNWWKYIVSYDNAVNKKVEIATCKIDLFENDKTNVPGSYKLKNKLTEVFPGQTVVVRSQIVNEGNQIIPNIRTYTSVNVNSSLLDGNKNCKANKPIGYTCDFSKTAGESDLMLSEVNFGVYRLTLPSDLAAGSEFAIQHVYYKNQVDDTWCSRKVFPVRSK